jgi:Tol biopolymer transport system component
VNSSGTGAGSAASYLPVINDNGRFILFRSKANNLAPGLSGGNENLFLRDRQLNSTYALTRNGLTASSMTPDGHFVAYLSSYGGYFLYVWDSQVATTVYTNATGTGGGLVAISPDGNRLAYSVTSGFYGVDRLANSKWQIGPALFGNHLGLQFSGDARYLVYATTDAAVSADTNRIADVYLYDFENKTNFLISRRLGLPGAGNGPSDSPAISTDGRFVVYRSAATDILPGATNGLPNVFLYDRQTGVTTLFSASMSGDFAADNRSMPPMFSPDGQTVYFQSWASDLVAQDFNQGADLFAIKIATANPTPVFAGQIVFVPTSGQSPTLTWPAEAGKSYQVQFKGELGDAVWQPLSGNVWVAGNQGFASDLAPNPGQRFYRIVAF